MFVSQLMFGARIKRVGSSFLTKGESVITGEVDVDTVVGLIGWSKTTITALFVFPKGTVPDWGLIDFTLSFFRLGSKISEGEGIIVGEG